MLTWKARYALIAIADLAERHASQLPIRLSDISLRQNISITYLEQLFLKLRKHGIVSSKKGPGGGYVLSKNPNDIKVIDVMEAVDECIKTNGCDLDRQEG